jgi:hypothetical protein
MLGNRKVSRGLSVPLDCLRHDGFSGAERSVRPANDAGYRPLRPVF